ncbi:signal recognition particle-docking protein FtsY [Peptoniphilus equinus]|uniref:Signal recognition particle receptor FtsY n=1 Tax=Peptoniphilus equinus TaxID=3016343 RepID=A0ABY7QV79_9FIRM|nr:signal recognition particle-docking protein FtsY [Peptoniphilus equinus]WBW50622.1 signal recognition particle-docking protein FtsY [Peptoniphilus equinus]
MFEWLKKKLKGDTTTEPETLITPQEAELLEEPTAIDLQDTLDPNEIETIDQSQDLDTQSQESEFVEPLESPQLSQDTVTTSIAPSPDEGDRLVVDNGPSESHESIRLTGEAELLQDAETEISDVTPGDVELDDVSWETGRYDKEVEGDSVSEPEASESEMTVVADDIESHDEEQKTSDTVQTTEDSFDSHTEALQPEAPKLGFFQKLKKGLSKTREEMGVKINTVLGAYVKIDDDLLEDLEDVLISADIGMTTTMTLIDNLRETIIQNKVNDPSQVMPLLKEEIKKAMNPSLNAEIETASPTVILVIGVNGVGKTTTIGKLAARLKGEGKSVIIAAADTFRAAAIDQLKTWGSRAGVDVIHHQEGADPAAVIYDGIQAAKSRRSDILICDTAGRLHNKANLMKELEKINRVIGRDFPQAHRETLLVLDATTGQNALSQAKTFNEVSEITGIVLTKLDGTAKGGVIIALQSELNLPVKLVGVGEGVDDLQKFNIDDYVDAIIE